MNNRSVLTKINIIRIMFMINYIIILKENQKLQDYVLKQIQ